MNATMDHYQWLLSQSHTQIKSVKYSKLSQKLYLWCLQSQGSFVDIIDGTWSLQ